MTMYPKITIGDTLTCSETGKQFVAAADGCSFNWAIDRNDNVLSDEGVDIREKRELLDRSKPFNAYLASDSYAMTAPRTLTGWKGNVLGHVIAAKKIVLPRWSHTHGSHLYAVTIRDVHGQLWHGRGNAGVAITLRPKTSRR